MRKYLLAAVASLAFAGSAQAAAFMNGGFEAASVNPGGGFATLAGGSTAITGWTVGGNSIDYIGGYWQPQEGARSIDLSGNAAGSLSQTFDTIAGQLYEVNFFLAGNPDSGPLVKMATTTASGNMSQTDNFTVVPGVNTRPNMGWLPYSYRFTANAASTTLTFASATQTAFGPALDNVSVAAVPEPATWGMFILGFGLIGGAMRRRTRARARVTA